MKAIVYTKYGSPDVLQLQDIEKPSPKDNEVLVSVHAASVNALDWRPFTMPLIFVRMMRGGLFEPKDTSLGADIAERVEAVGASVRQFQLGMRSSGMQRSLCRVCVCC